MKLFLFSIALIFSLACRAQEIPKITPDQAYNYIGRNVIICGEVKGAYVSPKNRNTFLNFGADYPNQTFSVVIYASDAKKFSTPPAEAFKDKTICVTGIVLNCKDKPQIEVTDPLNIQQ